MRKAGPCETGSFCGAAARNLSKWRTCALQKKTAQKKSRMLEQKQDVIPAKIESLDPLLPSASKGHENSIKNME